MGQAIAITRSDHSAGELRKLAGASDDAEVVRRLLALAMVLDGCSRTEAARNNGMDRQTLRDWVHRYNAEGIDGLIPTAQDIDPCERRPSLCPSKPWYGGRWVSLSGRWYDIAQEPRPAAGLDRGADAGAQSPRDRGAGPGKTSGGTLALLRF